MMVGQKRKASNVSGFRYGNDRKRQAISMDTKMRMIKRLDRGEKW